MGGDYAPENVIRGALDALRETGNRFEVIFVGPETLIRETLHAAGSNGTAYQIVHAAEVVGMHDAATSALKEKKNSSISVAMTLHRDGGADAFVSAGHSGAVMSTATLILGRIEGVSRPTIGTFLPSEKGVCLLVDAGANVDCKPHHLYEFGVMGSIYASQMLNIENPAVGLLSIGEESTKGNEATKEAYKLLEQSSLRFLGNVEGRDILAGKADVVVCDGFVGNIVLKFAESVPAFLKSRLRQYTAKRFWAKIQALMARGVLRGSLRTMDYEEYGGVPVLGVNGVSIIGHGKSTPKAIKNMVLKAEETVMKRVNLRIQESFAALKT
jgi:glycerol-3-phosphate acyltransferase PlsX